MLNPGAHASLCCALLLAALALPRAASAQSPTPEARTDARDAVRQLRVLRALAANERTQRLLSGSTYIITGALYLSGAAVLRSNSVLLVDPVSQSVSVEMLVAGPVEIAYGIFGLAYPGAYESLARELDRELAAEGARPGEAALRSLQRWERAAARDRIWLRVYGVTGIALGAGTLGFGGWSLFASPFNNSAIGLNAVLGVTAIAAGALGIGYGIGALLAESSTAQLLDAFRGGLAPVARYVPRPTFGLTPLAQGARVDVSFLW